MAGLAAHDPPPYPVAEELGGGLPRREYEERAVVAPYDPIQNGGDDFPVKREPIPLFRRKCVVESFNISREAQRCVPECVAAVILPPANKLGATVGAHRARAAVEFLPDAQGGFRLEHRVGG